jgi:hypothetical protein
MGTGKDEFHAFLYKLTNKTLLPKNAPISLNKLNPISARFGTPKNN